MQKYYNIFYRKRFGRLVWRHGGLVLASLQLFACAAAPSQLPACHVVGPDHLPSRQVAVKLRQLHQEQYQKKLHEAVKHRWRAPGPKQIDPGHDMCRVRLLQNAKGCIRRFSFIQCKSPIMRNTLRRAIIAASPLPKASYRELFEEEIILVFMPKRW